MKNIKYYICGNGLGHFHRAVSVCKILKSTYNYNVDACVITSRPNISYHNKYFSFLEVINPSISELQLFSNHIIVSDNLIYPLWINRCSSNLLFHIGSFLWSKVFSVDPLFNQLDKCYMENLFLENNVHSFINQYFYDPTLHAPLIRNLHLHGLTDLISCQTKSDHSIQQDTHCFAYISLGLSLFALSEAQQVYNILASTIFSAYIFYFDKYLWENIKVNRSISWIKCRINSHQYCLSNARTLFIRPGLGTLNDILCRKIYSPLICCNFNNNKEIRSNIHAMRRLNYVTIEFNKHTTKNNILDILTNSSKQIPLQLLNYSGITMIAQKINNLVANLG